MSWADETRRLKVRANSDTGHDSEVARNYGAEGIGLCRTEHMFFGEDRLAVMREMILAGGLGEREKALAKLLPFQKQDFVEIFRAMNGLPVTIRLLDPPLHEFLPSHTELMAELTELKYEARRVSPKEMDLLLDEIAEKRKLLRRVEHLSEANPMLGLRGCRLGLLVPEVTRMQVRAIFEAACEVQGEGLEVLPEVMIPLVSAPEEFRNQAGLIREIAKQVMQEYGCELKYLVGTMIELPRAALVADKIAADAEFFSFGTNDLTQTTYGLSRDDAGRFLPLYVEKKIYPDDPFQTLDTEGVGQLIKIAIERGRSRQSQFENRRLRRARRRPALHRVFQLARLGLRQLLAVPRADCAALVGAFDIGGRLRQKVKGKTVEDSQKLRECFQVFVEYSQKLVECSQKLSDYERFFGQISQSSARDRAAWAWRRL